MTNSDLLKEKIKASGLKLSFIAEKLEISRNTLWKKVNNLLEFKQSEIAKISSLLRIESREEVDKIFLTKM